MRYNSDIKQEKYICTVEEYFNFSRLKSVKNNSGMNESNYYLIIVRKRNSVQMQPIKSSKNTKSTPLL